MISRSPLIAIAETPTPAINTPVSLSIHKPTSKCKIEEFPSRFTFSRIPLHHSTQAVDPA
jgi:hypothetical protein